MNGLGRLNPLKQLTRLVLAEIGTKPVTLIVLVCGMIVTYLQYQAYLDSARVEKSFQMVEEWELRGYKDDFEAYAQTVLLLEAEAIAANGPPLPYIQRKLGDPDAEQAQRIANLYYFFDKMALCIQRDLCDGELLQNYFGTSVKGFWENTIAYLSNRRKRASDFGRFTESFASSVVGP